MTKVLHKKPKVKELNNKYRIFENLKYKPPCLNFPISRRALQMGKVFSKQRFSRGHFEARLGHFGPKKINQF